MVNKLPTWIWIAAASAGLGAMVAALLFR